MSEQKTYLITLDQLKEICSSKNPEARQKIMIDVVAIPFKERTAGSVIVQGIKSIFSAMLDLVDKETAPKKGSEKP